jgi:hypothetical protein
MRRIMMLLTVVVLMVVMMVAMAMPASAQATLTPYACSFQPNAEREEELGTVLLMPGKGPVGQNLVCAGRPFGSS